MKLERNSVDNTATEHPVDTSLRTAALAAGIGLTLMMVFAIFGNFFVLENLVVPGDVATSVENILDNEQLFRMGIFSLIMVIILDVIVAWALYVFLKPVNPTLSLLAGWFRLVYSAIFAVAVIYLVIALGILTGDGNAALFAGDQAHLQAMLSLNSFTAAWEFALAFFGLHLVLVGYLVFKSGYMPRILGVLVLIAGLGYTIDAFAGLLLPEFNVAIGMFTFIGEVLLGLWLLIKGLRSKEWVDGALKTA